MFIKCCVRFDDNDYLVLKTCPDVVRNSPWGESHWEVPLLFVSDPEKIYDSDNDRRLHPSRMFTDEVVEEKTFREPNPDKQKQLYDENAETIKETLALERNIQDLGLIEMKYGCDCN